MNPTINRFKTKRPSRAKVSGDLRSKIRKLSGKVKTPQQSNPPNPPQRRRRRNRVETVLTDEKFEELKQSGDNIESLSNKDKRLYLRRRLRGLGVPNNEMSRKSLRQLEVMTNNRRTINFMEEYAEELVNQMTNHREGDPDIEIVVDFRRVESHREFLEDLYRFINSNTQPMRGFLVRMRHIDISRASQSVTYSLTNDNMRRILARGNLTGTETAENQMGSDQDTAQILYSDGLITFIFSRKGRTRPKGNFFKYFNKLDLDLSRYQIYTREQYTSDTYKVPVISDRDQSWREDLTGKLVEVLNNLGIKNKLVIEDLDRSVKLTVSKTYNVRADEIYPTLCKIIDSSVFSIMTSSLVRGGVTYQSFTINKRDGRKVFENCLIHTLRLCDISEILINSVKPFIRNGLIRKIDLREIGKIIGVNITLHEYTPNQSNKIRKTQYTLNKQAPIIEIGLFKDHYFKLDPVVNACTVYYIKNIATIPIDCPNKYHVYSKRLERDPSRALISSFKLIYTAFECGLFEEMTNKDVEIGGYIHRETNPSIYLKNYTEENVRKYTEPVDGYSLENKKRNKVKSELIDIEKCNLVVVDLETYNNKSTQYKHNVFSCAYSFGGETLGEFYNEGPDCVKDFFKDVVKKYGTKKNGKPRSGIPGVEDSVVTIVAHNMNYDKTFLIDHLSKVMNYIDQDGTFYMCTGRVGDITVKLIDSYKYIPSSLRSFPELFDLTGVQKEIGMYDFFNENYGEITTYGTLLSKFMRYCKESERDDLINLCLSNNLLSNEYKRVRSVNDITEKTEVDFRKYNEIYNKMDVRVLRRGFLKFRGMVHIATKLDILDYLTISSITHNYMLVNDVYSGCYQNKGFIREFIQGALVGGKTMTRNNSKHHITKTLNDFDGVSLYPSAIDRLCNELGGVLQGQPCVLHPDQLNYEYLSTLSGYFVDIRILSHEKEYAFPLYSKIDPETGVRCFTNKMDGQIIRVDKIQLEDLIKFHLIKFEILQGIGYGSGRGVRFGEIINRLFQERLNYKKQGNPIQQVFKLMMNSSYGKTIQRMNDTSVVQVPKNEFDKYFSYHYDEIVSFEEYEKYYFFTIRRSTDYSCLNQIGVEILSMSKRIMNEVTCLAEDLGIEIYYMDTDSLHVENDKIELLASEFRRVYNHELIGKGLCQFHNDFTLNGCNDVVSVESYFLGKKCYIDKIQGVDSDGDIKQDYHIRCKGVGTDAILYHCKERGITPIDLYKELYEGVSTRIDTSSGGTKARFKHLNKVSVISLRPEDCFRTIKF